MILKVREVSGKIRALISATTSVFSAQLVRLNGAIFKISAKTNKKLRGAYLSLVTSRSGLTISTKIRYNTNI
jgi:hypothetical protein